MGLDWVGLGWERRRRRRRRRDAYGLWKERSDIEVRWNGRAGGTGGKEIFGWGKAWRAGRAGLAG